MTLLRSCVEAAVAAPSIHNSQPWRFRAGPPGLDVLADRSRLLSVVDPDGRELFVSLGAAVFNARIAMLAHGCTPVCRLFPDPEDPDLVARITPGPATHPSRSALALYHAVTRRHTNRRPFDAADIPAAHLAELRAAAGVEGAVLSIADDPARELLLSLIRTAEGQLRRDPAYWLELAEWSGTAGTRTDGVPAPAFGPWSAAETMPLRDFGLVLPTRRRHVERFEPRPTIAVLRSRSDGPQAWVQAGEALERVLLTATVRGVSATPMTQPLEIDELRQLLNAPSGTSPAQVILRLGYGPPCTPSPRRPVDEVLTVDPDSPHG